MKKTVYTSIILSLLLPIQSVSAKTPGLHKVTTEKTIVKDADNYYGEGYGVSYEEACSYARANLLSNIVVNVEGSFIATSKESFSDEGTETKEEINSMVKSFSASTTLHNVNYEIMEKTPLFRVMCSVSKEDVAKMYELRRDKVLDLVRSAQRAESKGGVNNALRYLYQAYVLLHSLQYPDEVKENIDGVERLLVNWIPERMNEICSDVKFSIVSNEGNIYNMLVTYKGNPAKGVDYSYWDGQVQSPIIGAKDGKGEISFTEGMNPEDVNIVIEYEYATEVHSDPQVAPLLRSFQGHSVVRENTKFLKLNSKESLASKAEKKSYEVSLTAGHATGVAEVAKGETKQFSAAMNRLVKAISLKNYASVSDLFTQEGLGMYKSLLEYGNARLLVKPEKVDYQFYPMKDRTVCRSIPMSFSFNGGKKKFIEDVTFTFNPEGKIESLAFSLGSTASECIFSKGGDKWGDFTKMTIASFLENYKTAFALKRLDYIKSIFDEDALIIVGHVVKKAPATKKGDMMFALHNQEEVNYYQKSKKEYIDQLEKCFKSNEYVNIRFADNDIAKAGYGGNTFGIQIKQDYASSSYGDQGYLFLMVDFNDEEAPLITIRTWQPERMKELTPNLPKDSRDYGIFSLGYFE